MHRKYTPDHHHHHHRPPGDGRVLPRIKWRWWLLAALLIWAASGVYTVEPSQKAVVWRCGRILDELAGPGLHVGFPYGIDRVTRLKMFEQKRVGVGRSLDERGLGRTLDPRRAECLSGDQNLLLVSAIVQYEIVDARRYLTGTADVAAMIESLATASLSNAIAGRPVDDVLTVGRLEIQQQVLAAVRNRLERQQREGLGLGVQVNSVTLEEVRAPSEVEQAFRDVVAAREDRQRTIHEAQAYANALLPTARGEAERIRLESEGAAAQTQQQARGDTQRFSKMLAALDAGRELTVKRLILETLETVLPKLKKVVVDSRPDKPLDLGLIEDQP